MKRSREESQSGPSEGPFPRLHLPLTTTPEFIKSIESILQEDYPCPNTKTLTPPEKSKALSIPISMITIGEWSHSLVYPDDLKAKFYFAKKKLMWEILDDVKPRTQDSSVKRLKRKIELKWSDVLSFKATFHPRDETATLEIELEKPPTFFMETTPQAGKHTQWEDMADFTRGHSASLYRRHKLDFFPGDLQKTLEKLVSANSFWSKLAKISFPTLPGSLYFDIDYGNNNDNDSSNLSPYGNYQALSNDPSHHHYTRVEDFNMATQFRVNDGRQMRNTGEFDGSQAYAQETQTNSMIFQHAHDHTISQIGPYVLDLLTQEEIHMQNMDAYFQTNRQQM